MKISGSIAENSFFKLINNFEFEDVPHLGQAYHPFTYLSNQA